MFGIIADIVSTKAREQAQREYALDMFNAAQDARAAYFQRRYGDRYAGTDYNTGCPIIWGKTDIPTVNR